MGSLAVLDRTGDTKLIWDPDNDVEVASARRTFDDLRAKGFLAYSVDKGGKKGTVIREFDPDAEKIILAPPMAGG
jgi:hypothetical protein